jgi:hypothetical protein
MSMASDATKTMFEDMVKKVMMDMVIDNDPILVNETISSEKESKPVKAGRRRSWLSRKLRSKIKSSDAPKSMFEDIMVRKSMMDMMSDNDPNLTINPISPEKEFESSFSSIKKEKTIYLM